MKQYEVDVDITMSCRIEVDAESEEEAKTIVANWIGDDPWFYVKDGHYMSHEFEAVNETGESEHADLEAALDYVREQLDADELMIYKATVSKNLNHRMPATAGLDDGKIIDLLEEYGEDNDMPEGWWEEYGDIEDVLMKL